MFAAQVAVAGSVAGLILLLGGPRAAGTNVLGWILAGLALVQIAVGVVLPDAVARSGSKGAALAAALLAAVLLATPAWYLVLGLLTAQAALPLLLLGAAVGSGYAVGFGLTGRCARRLGTHSSAGEDRV